MTIKLLIADDEELVRAGLRDFVQGTDVEIVGEPTSVDELLEMARREPPDVVLLNPGISPGPNLDVVRQLRRLCPNTAVVLFAATAGPALLFAGMNAEAAGLLLRDASRDTIIAALHKAVTGRLLWTRQQLRRAAAAPGQTDADLDVPLTPRELQVLAALVQGLTNKQIAQQLNISYETVKEHVQHLLDKIGVVDRTQAAVWAVRRHLV